METFEDFLSEGKKIQIKRKYTENHPASTVGKAANVRNAVLKAVKDGVITEEEFTKILSELSGDYKQWRTRNTKYFNVSEEGIKLSKWGLRILAELDEEPKAAGVFEATVEMDALNPDDKDFLKFLKKNKVKIINKEMDGPGGGTPVITMKGKRKDLEKVLADDELGWGDPDLAEYIEESVNEKIKVTKDEWPYVEFKDGGKKHKVEFDYEDIIDDHGNEGQDQYWIGKDEDGQEWQVDVYADYRGEVEEIHYDTLMVAENKSVNEKDDAGTHLDNLADLVGNAKDFFAIGKELKSGKYKYDYSDSMMPMYTIKADGFKFAILNKRYVDSGDREVGEIAIGLLENIKTNMKKENINEAKELSVGDKGVDYNDNVVEVIAIGKYRQIAKMFKKEMKADAEDYGFEELAANTDYYLTKNIEATEGNVGDFAIYPVRYDMANYWGLDPLKESFNLFESFGDFLSSQGILNEAINSAILRTVLSNGREGKQAKKNLSQLAKGFYGLSKVALDKIQDEDFIVSNDVSKVFKNYGGSSHVLFFISDNEKENPYYDHNNGSWNDYKVVPGGGVVLAAMSGDRQFYANEWSRWSGGRAWSKNKKGDEGQIGINHKYRGWGASGLNNGKRISEMSDRVIVINLELIRQKYSTEQLRAARKEARAGATAFKSDKDFKDANNARYHKILADKAASLPLDKMVKGAIEALGKQLADGLAKGESTQYGEIKIGVNPKGRDVKAKDASHHMSNILDDYGRYVDYIRQGEESEARYGQRESYYEREAKNYAKAIKDKIAKIESFDYAW